MTGEPPAGPLIAIEGVSKSYGQGEGEVRALREVALEILAGEFVAVVGESGSGKSTLMNLIGCLDLPSSGRILFNGEETTALDAAALARFRNRTVGFVFQAFNLLPRLTALDNVALPLIYRNLPRPDRLAAAGKALERVGLGDRLGHRPAELSGGQQQRVAIARALVGDPALLLADEPTGSLDSATADEILATLGELNAGGVTIMVVTHAAAVAARARRCVALRDGRVIEDRRQSGESAPAVGGGLVR